MNLYELNKMYIEALDGAIDENGEIKSDILAELLGEISEAKEVKVLNLACFIKNLEADAEAIDFETKRLQARKKSASNKAESLTRYLRSSLNDGESYKDARAEIAWRKSSSVEISSEVDDFARQYPELCRIKYEPSKTDIKKRIESGDLVLGAEIVTKQNMVIK